MIPTSRRAARPPTRSVALSGRSGAGKSTLAAHLAERFGFAHCQNGPLCRDICRQLFQSESKTILNAVTDAMRLIRTDVWIEAALRNEDPGSLIVFDSMRFATDYDFFKARGFALWRVEAPLAERTRRLRARGQEFDPVVDDIAPAETELDDYEFDAVLLNGSGDPTGMLEQVDELMPTLS